MSFVSKVVSVAIVQLPTRSYGGLANPCTWAHVATHGQASGDLLELRQLLHSAVLRFMWVPKALPASCRAVLQLLSPLPRYVYANSL